jgi:kumamolisin
VFRQPSYQSAAGVPPSLNDSSVGRGIPDVAANASALMGYIIYINGLWNQVGGTSAAAPLIAGFIAQLNAQLGKNVGFLNPKLYSTRGAMCRKITAGAPLNGQLRTPPPRPADNAFQGVTGYRGTQTGWDACTGWGVFVWNNVVAVLNNEKEKRAKEFKDIKDKLSRKSARKKEKERGEKR